MRFNRGISLIEVLTSIVIVALIMAIVFPVISNARRAGYKAVSMSNLRQIGMAVGMYHDMYEEYPLRHLDSVVDAGFIRDDRILINPLDLFERGYGYEVAQCTGGNFKSLLETSFETPFGGPKGGLLPLLLRIDQNPGIVVDRTLGTYSSKDSVGCEGIVFAYTASMSRLRLDGSVRHAHFSTDPPDDATPGTRRVFRKLRLFTDVDVNITEIE